MTTITDKLRRRDFKTKPPQIQPTLKNTIVVQKKTKNDQ